MWGFLADCREKGLEFQIQMRQHVGQKVGVLQVALGDERDVVKRM